MDPLVLATLTGLARNSSAPVHVLLRLLDSGQHNVRFALLWRSRVPVEIYDAVVAHPDEEIRRLLPDNWYVPAEQRARLACDPEALIRLRVAQGPEPFRQAVDPLPAEVYAMLARDPDPKVRAAVASQPAVSTEVRLSLVGDPDPGVRASAIGHWTAPPGEVVETLLGDSDQAVRRSAMLKGYQDRPELVHRLLADESLDAFERREIAEDAPLDRALAEQLARHTDDGMRSAVAANPNLPADLAQELAQDREHAVRLAASMRPELTEEQRAAIDYHVKPRDRIGPPQWVWRNFDDLDVMRRCVHSAHLGLRRAAAYSPHLTADLVGSLARDEDFIVRLLLAENHPNAPGDLLLAVMLESRFVTRYDQMNHQNFPREGLARFAHHEDPILRSMAPFAPDCPPALIERLSHDADPGVRSVAAADPRLPTDRLLQMLDDPEAVSAAAANPALPVAVIEDLVANSLTA